MTTTAVAHAQIDDAVEHICPCRLPPPAQLRAIRRSAGVGLSKAASRIGVDAMTLSRWERGLHQPRARYIPAYLRLLAEMAEQGRQHTQNIAQK